MNKTQQKYKGVWDALSLITIGIILLLNTTGVLSWRFWFELFKLWPILLITTGISIIFSGTERKKFIADGIGYIVFLLAVIFSLLGYTKQISFSFINSNGRLVEYEQTVDSNDITKPLHSLNLQVHAGKMIFLDEQKIQGNNAVTIQGKYSESVSNKPNGSVIEQGEFTSIEFESANGGFGIFGSEEYEFSVSEFHNPKNLTLSVGAGDAQLSLKNDSYEQIEIETGTGSVELNMENDSFANLKLLIIDVGAGSTTLSLPKDIEYTVQYDVGVGSFENPYKTVSGLGQKGTLNSDQYDATKDILLIQAKVGVGSLTIIEE